VVSCIDIMLAYLQNLVMRMFNLSSIHSQYWWDGKG